MCVSAIGQNSKIEHKTFPSTMYGSCKGTATWRLSFRLLTMLNSCFISLIYSSVPAHFFMAKRDPPDDGTETGIISQSSLNFHLLAWNFCTDNRNGCWYLVLGRSRVSRLCLAVTMDSRSTSLVSVSPVPWAETPRSGSGSMAMLKCRCILSSIRLN